MPFSTMEQPFDPVGNSGIRRLVRNCASDAVLVAVSLVAAALLRYDLVLGDIDWVTLSMLIAVGVVTQCLGGAASGLYLGHWRAGTADELRANTIAATATACVVVIVNRYGFHHRGISSSVGVIGSLIFVGLLVLERYRRERQHRSIFPLDSSAPRALIVGAGEAATQLLEAIARDPYPAVVPVALLDDDPAKQRLRLAGVRVAGTTDDIGMVSTSFNATKAIVAMPSAPDPVIKRIAERARNAGLAVTVLPSISSVLGVLGTGDAVTIADAHLLGREEVSLGEAARYISGKRVLVTGAGGSIGAELSRQISRLSPQRLFLLDRDESALHGTQLTIHGRALLDSPDLILADIRDGTRLQCAFADAHPDIVFHAAALKHVALLQQNPGEAFMTNVWGTINVLEAAAAHDVSRFVNVSTDKAADPVNVLGMSKRAAERITAHFAQKLDRPYVSVRFGNVLGSRGSVLTTFRAQLDAGDCLTVTDPETSRYFMTVSEAAQLVIQAGSIGRGTEVLVLDMGQPVKIADIARRLAATVEPPAEIIFTGLGPGEKLHEVLFAESEQSHKPFSSLISHVLAPPLSPGRVPVELPRDNASTIEMLRVLTTADVPVAPRRADIS